MSAVALAATLISALYPPAAPIVAWVAPIADALWTNRSEIADLVKGSAPAINAIAQAAPHVVPQIEDLARKVMLQFPGRTHEEVTNALAAKAVGILVPGWSDGEATRWMDLQNAKY